VIVVALDQLASYGLGIPSDILKAAVKFQVAESLDLRRLLRKLVKITIFAQ